jgi:hypothetical protein
VITSDVTHGLIDPQTGFDKFDSYCAVTPGRGLFVLVQAIIRNEQARTFASNMELLCERYPHLRYDEFVLVVDCDPAKILAARTVFRNVIIVLCIKHLRDNFNAKRGIRHHVVSASSGTQLLQDRLVL